MILEEDNIEDNNLDDGQETNDVVDNEIDDTYQPSVFAREMKSAYLDYSLSVIISRALPDARDGLKPVQRRILYAMRNAGYDWSKPYKKSAGTVGDTLKNYHPHGNTPVYEAMVRMAQDFSLRLPLIDGQGNFGSMDGDQPAAERYTEARLAYSARYLLHEDDLYSVPYEPNYDNSTTLPSVLPARFPNLLVNGASGIAVGMATNISPHNLTETLEASKALLQNPGLTIDELMEYVKGPDFPMGGEICGRSGIIQAYKTGKGAFVLRGIYHMENDDKTLVITTLPYQVNKAKFIDSITSLIKDGEIDEISDIRDETNELGVRVVIELKRNACQDTLVNKLLSKTQLQTNISMNILAVLDKQPLQMNLKKILQTFLEFRESVVIKRTLIALSHAKIQSHKLWGLALAISDIDNVIKCIQNSADRAEAEKRLIEIEWPSSVAIPFIKLLNESMDLIVDDKYHFTPEQAKAITELRLYNLTRLENTKLNDEVKKLAKDIEEFLRILHDREVRKALMIEEFDEVIKKIGTPRRTIISNKEANVSVEDMIEDNLMVVTLSMSGYIKRVNIDNYRVQRRGGKGKSSSNLHSDDVSMLLLTVTNLTSLLFFSSQGKVYSLKVYQLPETSTGALGKALVNLLPLDHANKEKITNVMAVDKEQADKNIVFVTEAGHVRRNSIDTFSYIPSNGKRAMKDGEIIVSVFLIGDEDHIILTTYDGKAIRFACDELRVMQSRDSAGVRGINLLNTDKVVSGIKVTPDDDKYAILTISINGYGKRTKIVDYRCAKRAGQGVSTMSINKRTGHILTTLLVKEDDNIMLLTRQGQLVRCSVKDIRMSGRNTQGVTLINLNKDDELVNAVVVQEDDEEIVGEENNS